MSDLLASLRAAGTALRQGDEPADAMLRRIGQEELAQWLARVSTEAIREALLKATLQAVEAGLSEGDEAATWRAWAFEALCERDSLESLLAGAGRWSALHAEPQPIAAALRTLQGALREIDEDMETRSRWLVSLNVDRRARRDSLLPAERDSAWWFSARAECDGLLAALAGSKSNAEHAAGCRDCREDLAAAKTVHARRLRHLKEDELWRFDVGLASDGERAVIQAHADRCSDCAQAVQMVEDGEQFIAEAIGEPPQPRRPDEAMRARRREVLAEQRGFRLVLIREQKRTKLLIERSGAKVARAEAQLGGKSLAAMDGPEGWEVDLPEGAAGPTQVRIYVAGQAAPVTLLVSL